MSEETDEDEVDYINDLREGVLEGYTGLIVGMKGDGDAPPQDVVSVIMGKVIALFGYFVMLCRNARVPHASTS